MTKANVSSGTRKRRPQLTNTTAPEPDTEVPIEREPAKDFPIVGIGASAGGLTAFETFLSAMPFVTDKGIALVLVQHLAPDHKSVLTELVKRYTRMQVYEVTDGMEVKPNSVYIIPPNRDMALLGGKLQLLEPSHVRGLRLTIDYFFRSLAADQRHRSICIVLSGTGSDGSLGIRAIKGEGGMVMVQSPSSTEFDGMPRSAIATGLADYVLTPAEMPAQLIAYVNRSFERTRPSQPSSGISPDLIAKACVLLRNNTGHDFSQYKETTIIRRIERRMALHQIERATDYIRYLQQTKEEADALFRDLLIGVTSFFRDPAFKVLEDVAIPELFKNVSADGAIRIWVCGCSTGEEAYSIAMLIQEYLERSKGSFRIQIFATDIDRRATDQARAGLFHPSNASDISAERLERHFKREIDGSYRINKVIRDRVIFSEQDVLQDPPFSKLSLISCRNLLIYLSLALQKRLIPLFHYSLNPGGILFLGSSETIGDHVNLFDTLDRKAKLYVRRAEGSNWRRTQLIDILSSPSKSKEAMAATTHSDGMAKFDFREVSEQAVLRHVQPTGVLVNSRGEILYFYGRSGKYLEPAPGNASSNIFNMARDGIRRELTAALQLAISKKDSIKVENLRVDIDATPLIVDIHVLPVVPPGSSTTAIDLFFVLFEEHPILEASGLENVDPTVIIPPEANARIALLEHEIRAKDEYIHTIIEEMATSSEELKSSVEELQSVNEEMQSTNEELETSKEELQSVNEELSTVNGELSEKVASLSRANSDMDNLMAGTGVGTLFVDHQLRITRFTPAITQVINLIPSDVGRPLAHTVTNLRHPESMVAEIQKVLDKLVPVESEVEAQDGRWYLLGIRPYRTLNNIIEGAVLTFVEITERKTIEMKLKKSEHFVNAMEVRNAGVAFVNDAGSISFCNDAFLTMYGYSRTELMANAVSWHSLTPDESLPAFRKSLDELQRSGRTTLGEWQFVRKDGSLGWGSFSSHRLTSKEYVCFVVDVTQRRAAEESARLTREAYQSLLSSHRREG